MISDRKSKTTIGTITLHASEHLSDLRPSDRFRQHGRRAPVARDPLHAPWESQTAVLAARLTRAPHAGAGHSVLRRRIQSRDSGASGPGLAHRAYVFCAGPEFFAAPIRPVCLKVRRT